MLLTSWRIVDLHPGPGPAFPVRGDERP